MKRKTIYKANENDKEETKKKLGLTSVRGSRANCPYQYQVTHT